MAQRLSTIMTHSNIINFVSGMICEMKTLSKLWWRPYALNPSNLTLKPIVLDMTVCVLIGFPLIHPNCNKKVECKLDILSID